MREIDPRPVDEARPLVCLDEFAKQPLSEFSSPIPATRRPIARHDYEYVREGSVSDFILAMSHLGGRQVFIGKDGRMTARDFAACLDDLANHVLPEADNIVLMMDNLNTHKEASPYEAFPPEKACE